MQPGEIELSATFSGKGPDGKTVTGTVAETWDVVERPLKVTVTPHLRKADGTLPELNLDNDGDGDIDLDDHRFDVEVEISNDSDEPMTNLTFSDEAEPVNWSNNLLDEGQGAPKLTLIGVRGEPPAPGPDGKPVKGPIEPLDVSIPDLAAKGEAGDSHTFTFVYEATGELDATGHAIVEGKQGDRAVKGSGVADVQFASGLLLEFSSWLTDPDRLTTSGQVVRIGGYLKNLDEDKKDANGKVTKKGRSIAVWITPVTEGNAGSGYLVPREGGATPLGAEFLELAPGQRMDLHGILTSRPTPVRTDAHVEYLVSAWNLPEEAGDAANPIAQERIDLVEDADKGWGPIHDQRLQFADVGKQDLKACETHLYDAIVTCNFYEGLKSMLTDTRSAAIMAKAGVEQIGQATYWTGAWAMAQFGDIAAALEKDPAAQARLVAEINVQLSTWYDMSILAGDAAATGVGAFGQFLHQTVKVVKEGDTETALSWIAKYAGENPDQALGFIFKGRALAAMGQSILNGESRSVAGTIVRDAVESEASLASRKLAAEIDLAVARGIDPKTPSVLKGGLDVTDNPKVWRDVYGAARDDVQKMLQIAKEEGVLIAFRSRSATSIKLLEERLAWLKPQSVKAKTVSKIDIKYLGFPEDSLGKVVMVQPPFGAQLTGQALEDALDQQMVLLKKSHPELLDKALAGEVRDRMKLRATKYHEHLAEWIDYAENGMPVGFGYSKNGVTSARDVEELRNAKIEVSQVPNPNGGEPLTRIDLKIAGPDGTDFRHLTGDIDIVGFFNLDRSPIMDAAKREIMYEKMRSLLGMQHGETLTWDHQKRAELLREHVGDNAETLLVASPDERLYTSVLDEKKSSEVAPGGNFADTFTLLDGPPKELKSPVQPPGPAATGRLASIADQVRTHLPKAEPFLLPGSVVDRLKKTGATVPTTTGQSTTATPLVVRPDGHIEAYQPPPAGGPTPKAARAVAPVLFSHGAIAPRAVPEPDPGLAAAKALLGDNNPYVPRPDVGAEGGGWQPISLEQALALDQPGALELPVQTWTDATTLPGDTTLSVLTTEQLGLSGGDWFTPGDTVVVDPGGAYEQLLTVTAVDGHLLTFDAPLTHRMDDPVQVLHLPKSTNNEGSGGGAGPGPQPTDDPTTMPSTGDGTGPVDRDGDYLTQAPSRILSSQVIAANSDVPFTLPSSVPAGTGAVAINVTAIHPNTVGNLRVYPDCGAEVSDTSLVNYQPGKDTANFLVLSLQCPDGTYTRTVDFYSANSGVSVDVDLAGTYPTTTGGTAGSHATATSTPGYTGVGPTRTVNGQTIPANTSHTFTLSGIPTGAKAVALNVTAIHPNGNGNLRVYPGDQTTVPTTSNVNVIPGVDTSGFVIINLPADGSNAIKIYSAGNSSNVNVDVFGVISAGASTRGLAQPVRVLDTRTGSGTTQDLPDPLNTGMPYNVTVTGNGVPSNASAVVVNLTAIHAHGSSGVGNLRAYPTGGALPNVSNINYIGRKADVANLAIVRVGDNGQITLVTNGSLINAAVDILGYIPAAEET